MQTHIYHQRFLRNVHVQMRKNITESSLDGVVYMRYVFNFTPDDILVVWKCVSFRPSTTDFMRESYEPSVFSFHLPVTELLPTVSVTSPPSSQPSIHDYDTELVLDQPREDTDDVTRTTPMTETNAAIRMNHPLRRDMAPLPLEKSKKLASLFDLFRPLVLPTLPPFKNVFGGQIKGASKFAQVKRIASPFLTTPVFILDCSPPISWTFCEPLCGSGDQAVDSENAMENIQLDISEAVAEAFKRSHLPAPTETDVEVQYHPYSIILEDFGDYFDKNGFRYKINGNAVAFKYHKNSTGALEPFYVKVSTRVTYHMSLSASSTRNVANQMYQYLALYKGARFQHDIKIQQLDNI